MNLHEILASVR